MKEWYAIGVGLRFVNLWKISQRDGGWSYGCLLTQKNGYTYDFEVYTGKCTPVSKFGLAYDVVWRLTKSIWDQGYHLFFENFYTGVQLLIDLIQKKGYCCGTLLTNRKNVPAEFKDKKEFNKSPRGYMS